MVREAGGLFIADEVQAGFCRSGRWWGYESQNVIPDIATMGKPMGNGMPLSGVVARAELVEAFRRHSTYFNTFAATPLQAAAGLAVLDVIEKENLQENAVNMGNYLRQELGKINCEAMGDIRGSGLFIALDWVSDRSARTPDMAGAVRVVNTLKDKGVLASNAGSESNVVKLRPPLVFNRQQADLFLQAFEETVAELYP